MSGDGSIYDQFARLVGQMSSPAEARTGTNDRSSARGHHNSSQSRGSYRGSGGYYGGASGYRGGFNTHSDYGSYRGRYKYNGYRGGVYKPFRGRGSSYSRGGRGGSLAPRPHSHGPQQSLDFPCVNYTRTGKCEQANTCRFRHDPDHVALCMHYLKTGKCTKPGCTLSHQRKPENTPMCLHYANGKCTRPDCRYAHQASAGPDAPVCPEFARMSWCKRGTDCVRRHVAECPEFDATGRCSTPHCPLPHVLRHNNRSATAQEAGNSSGQENNKVEVGQFLAQLEDSMDEEDDENESENEVEYENVNADSNNGEDVIIVDNSSHEDSDVGESNQKSSSEGSEIGGNNNNHAGKNVDEVEADHGGLEAQDDFIKL